MRQWTASHTWKTVKRSWYGACKTRCLNILPNAQLKPWNFEKQKQRERERVWHRIRKRHKKKTVSKHAWQSWARIQHRVGECWSVSDPGPQEVWWIKRHRQRQRPSLNRGANPCETTSPSLTISLMVSISLPFLNHLLNSPFSLF